MKRAVFLFYLIASPATAQVASFQPTYAPGGLAHRPYINHSTFGGTYLPSQYQLQYRSPTVGQNADITSSYSRPLQTSPYSTAAGYRYFPNYPSQYSTPGGSPVSLTGAYLVKPLPVLEPLPTLQPCDPYTDEYGCLLDDYY